ncbi:serine hydrolase domain-containing protein [Neobacillus sp. PS2-9]|uniref:serine hydrolase domain-containing protein n=1 Tax=Neobacillus sp. PS2-9 TaxID=3070676 RepID=UPI0027E1A1A2|nr:serine hydrolase domain-containing protein [Neobacillus sp. PS2-9]WML56096.1 serine hydrolase domain-containing protein [Neobacillus sp. PS2-9]
MLCYEFINNYLSELEKENKFSGAVLVARNFKTEFKKAYGLSNIRFGIPNSEDTIFNLGSMGKMFTGVLIAQLEEEGKIKFTDKVEKHLSHLNSEFGKITIHQLLTHTSGLDSYFNEEFEKYSNRLNTLNQFFDLFKDSSLLFTPGEKFHYSNSGYVILGLIIEAITNENYYDYVKEKIFIKAGMTNTDFYEMDQVVPNLADGYTEVNFNLELEPDLIRNNIFIQGLRGSSAGGCFSTINDLLKFAEALENNVFISSSTLDKITDGKISLKEETNVSIKYGYGFFDRVLDGIRHYSHGGDLPGAHTDFRYYPEEKILIVVLSNNDIMSGKPRVEKVIEENIFKKYSF